MASATVLQVPALRLAPKLTVTKLLPKIATETSRSSFWAAPKNVISPLRASSEGFSVELAEDSKFVPLNPEDPTFGPPALLLLGFDVGEFDKIQKLLKDLDGEFLNVIYCTDDMITRSLWDAVNTRQQSLDKIKIANLVPRICFLSGLSGEEIMMFIEAFDESDLKPAIFAAVVPNSSDKPLEELIEEIMGDHEMVTAKQAESSQA